MKKLCTIGYTKKSLEQFIDLLRGAGVDLVIDVRLNNTSQLAGFSKRDDLAFLLREGFGIDYVHSLELAPTEELLKAYRSEKDWDAYRTGFAELIAERDMPALVPKLAEGHQTPCLLCGEDDASTCHRRLIAEAVADAAPGLEIVHLK